MQAASDPHHAGFVAWAAAYARCASGGEAQPEATVAARARALGAALRQAVREDGLRTLVRARLLWRGRGRVALPRPYRPYWPYFHTQVTRLAGATAFLVSRAAPPGVPDEAYRGLVLFDFGLFFACHEYFEGLWRESAGPRRDFYHGLVQLAAAFYHHEKGNRHGAVTLLRRAVRRLQAGTAEACGVDVAALLAELEPWSDRFAAGQSAPYPVLVAAP